MKAAWTRLAVAATLPLLPYGCSNSSALLQVTSGRIQSTSGFDAIQINTGSTLPETMAALSKLETLLIVELREQGLFRNVTSGQGQGLTLMIDLTNMWHPVDNQGNVRPLTLHALFELRLVDSTGRRVFGTGKVEGIGFAAFSGSPLNSAIEGAIPKIVDFIAASRK